MKKQQANTNSDTILASTIRFEVVRKNPAYASGRDTAEVAFYPKDKTFRVNTNWWNATRADLVSLRDALNGVLREATR